MAYIPPAGKAAKGEGAEDLPRIRIVYVERGFDCISLVGPGQDLLSAIQLAMDHGLTEASKHLGLARKSLRAGVSAPVHKDDGSLMQAKEWASKNCIYIQMDRGKEHEGLLGKLRKQHDYMEKLVRQNLVARDVSVSSSSQEVLDANTHSSYKTQVETLTSEKSDLKRQLETCSTSNSNLEEQITDLKKEVQTLTEEVSSLKTTISGFQKRLSELSGMEVVIMRKMLDECRQKALQILREQNVPLLDANWRYPQDWHKVLTDSGCMQLLQNAGLDKGLSATRFGGRSLHSSAAHVITESPELYATIVCKMTGDARDQMQNVFSFVFECKAEDLAFRDGESPIG